jgi:hypothetical protein
MLWKILTKINAEFSLTLDIYYSALVGEEQKYTKHFGSAYFNRHLS